MLEQRIEELTAAVADLTDVMRDLVTQTAYNGRAGAKHAVTAADIGAHRQDGESMMDTKKRLQDSGVPENVEGAPKSPKKSPSAASNTGPDAASETAPAHVEQPSTQEAQKPQTISPTSEPTEPESARVTYDDVKKVTIAVSNISKDKAVQGLAHFGVTSAKQLIESQWITYVVHMTAILGE